jgi:putative redox protein
MEPFRLRRIRREEHEMAEASKSAAGKLAQQVRIGDHYFMADVEPERGGDNLGPDAHDLLDAALAACTGLTLQMYAQRKGLAVTDVVVNVTHEESPGVTTLQRDIRIVGDVPADVRERMLSIADRCPVHKALSGRFEIASRLVE